MLANFFLVLPALPLLIVIFGFLPPSSGDNDLLIGLIIAITGWAWGARVLRAQTLSLRSRDYVDSARIIGERGWRVIGLEILPNLLPIVASSFLFTVLYGVGTYTALAFLGLINPEHWSWGSMLFEAQNSDAELSGYWWWYIPPGLMVAFLGTSLALLNFGIDEFINPRLRAAGLTRRRARKAGGQGLPRRFELGLTPVVAGHRTAPRPASTGPEPDPGAGVMTAEPLLDIRGLRVDYGAGPDAVHAVVDVDLMLRRGEVLGLAGESGSGKSTLAYAAIRLLRAPGMITGGEVLLLPRAGPDRGPARPGRAGTARAALVADRRGAAVRDERAEPGAVHRRPAHRRAAGAPAGPAGPGPHATGPPNCSAWSASPPTGSAATRTSCPAACGSG